MGGRSWFRRRDDFFSFSRDDVCCGNIREFSYASLQIATNNFSKDRLIGRGGWGFVYRGVLSDGTIAAIKNFGGTSSSQQVRKGFLRNLEVMSRIRHRNINQVIGYCVDNDLLLLVTEYVVNGSLFDLLRDESLLFNWDRRASICIGIARGLSYLHEDANPHIIHCDIKPGNILLESNYTPKIIDFDLVKFFYDPDEWELPHKTSRISGTYGYMAPEYKTIGQYSEKIDVFAFGVVMLEIISGRTVFDLEDKYGESENYIVSWASSLVKSGRVMEIFDPVLASCPVDVAQRFINVALLCVQRDPTLRPSMQEVLHMLYGVCNSNPSRVSLRWPDVSTLEIDDQILGIVWSDSQKEGLTATTYVEDKGDRSVLQDESNVKLTGNGSAENEWVETSTEEEREQYKTMTSSTGSHAATVSEVPVQRQQQAWQTKKRMKPGVILSGSGNLVERLSRTMVLRNILEIFFRNLFTHLSELGYDMGRETFILFSFLYLIKSSLFGLKVGMPCPLFILRIMYVKLLDGSY